VLRKNIFIKKFLWHKKFLGNLQKKNHIGHLTWAKWRHTWALGRAKWALAHAKCPPSRVKRRHLRAKVAPSVDQWRNLAPLVRTWRELWATLLHQWRTCDPWLRHGPPPKKSAADPARFVAKWAFQLKRISTSWNGRFEGFPPFPRHFALFKNVSRNASATFFCKKLLA